jgi:hypothetical protein
MHKKPVTTKNFAKMLHARKKLSKAARKKAMATYSKRFK